ncbi:carbohydrate ABC transporter ATP-binding protein, CUT1 family (TC 3.A.1.1.-) [Halogranum gelatinilyticum]|uniref:ABC-type D-xylose/L-arabinose transporter n=1 Tax=Halogranum gelatinilyticum TaxID=660521 RepID=A0A1G9ZMQ6_9EURY|nr:sn-glycerol-3-phosphate ABC transporter ATP-binding protein UgpC [Halogranum gelatinilyticum]SDN22639.1 carbohydrate ABC transporter ATP-binding protein, CUT1 family (TC 3.A.1.1.-) [Halogranum gelatinilyticum]
MGSIEVDNVRKVYDSKDGDIVAVNGVSLSVDDGEFVTIVGPSGSGKSTLLRMVAGLESITDGTISIDGTVINDLSPQNRGVAMVFQEYALYPHMNVRKNMSYGLKLTTDLPSEEIRDRVEETAEMMGIEDLLEKKPGNLSGGQQQRVATGRAIVRDPEVFLFDEPLSNLDAKLRLHMRTELQRLQEDLGTTSLYVTHDQTEAMTMSDRIVILDGGEIQQVGTPETVYAEPTNVFVADFIGSPSMNFFDVTLDGTRLVGADFEYKISDEIAERVKQHTNSSELLLGIRPEHISIDNESDGAIEAQLDVLEHEGSDNYLYLVKEETEWTARVPGNQMLDAGSHVSLTLPEEHIHLFEKSTERNILVEDEPSPVVQ